MKKSNLERQVAKLLERASGDLLTGAKEALAGKEPKQASPAQLQKAMAILEPLKGSAVTPSSKPEKPAVFKTAEGLEEVGGRQAGPAKTIAAVVALAMGPSLGEKGEPTPNQARVFNWPEGCVAPEQQQGWFGLAYIHDRRKYAYPCHSDCMEAGSCPVPMTQRIVPEYLKTAVNDWGVTAVKNRGPKKLLCRHCLQKTGEPRSIDWHRYQPVVEFVCTNCKHKWHRSLDDYHRSAVGTR